MNLFLFKFNNVDNSSIVIIMMTLTMAKTMGRKMRHIRV